VAAVTLELPAPARDWKTTAAVPVWVLAREQAIKEEVCAATSQAAPPTVRLVTSLAKLPVKKAATGAAAALVAMLVTPQSA
jgi:hypothetical protein